MEGCFLLRYCPRFGRAIPEKIWVHWPSGNTPQGAALCGMALGPAPSYGGGDGAPVTAYILQSKYDDMLEAFRKCFPEPKRRVTGEETGWPTYGYPPVHETIDWSSLYRNLGYDGGHGQTWLTAPEENAF